MLSPLLSTTVKVLPICAWPLELSCRATMNDRCTYGIKLLQHSGCCGVPILTGPPGSCESEATECALSPLGAHESHTCHNQQLLTFSRQRAKQQSLYMLMMLVRSQLMHGSSSLMHNIMALEEALAYMA